MATTMFKRKFSAAFFIMLFCLFWFTAGQYIPVYFTNSDYRLWFYIVLLLLFLGSMAVSLAKYIKGQGKVNYWWSITSCILLGGFMTIAFGLLAIALQINYWTDAATIYIQKNNRNIKIVSRYWNEGADGGGTSPDDYFIVLHRPVTPLFILETSVDTNKIDKTEWVKAPMQY